MNTPSNLNDSHAPVLVLGGTGSTGRIVVSRLLDLGYPVRVMSRSASKAQKVLGGRVEVIEGDLRVLEDVRRAAAAIDAVVLTHGSDDGKGSAQEIDYGGVAKLLEAVVGRDIKVVLMSAIYVTRPRHPSNNGAAVFAWKYRAEELLRTSGHRYSIVRASWLKGGGPGSANLVRFEQGDRGDGSVTHQAVAEALVAALRCARSDGKTFEVYGAPKPLSSFEDAFDTLQADEATAALA